MSDDIKQCLTEIESAAKRYQSITSEANKVIAEVDARLRPLDLNEGVMHSWVFKTKNKAGLEVRNRFGIMWLGGEYRLAYESIQGEKDAGEWRPLKDASRLVRVASLRTIPSMLTYVLEEVKRIADEVEAAKNAADAIGDGDA